MLKSLFSKIDLDRLQSEIDRIGRVERDHWNIPNIRNNQQRELIFISWGFPAIISTILTIFPWRPEVLLFLTIAFFVFLNERKKKFAEKIHMEQLRLIKKNREVMEIPVEIVKSQVDFLISQSSWYSDKELSSGLKDLQLYFTEQWWSDVIDVFKQKNTYFSYWLSKKT